jgi:4-hydroxy-3-polyprenylbenzoate decarboxylase
MTAPAPWPVRLVVGIAGASGAVYGIRLLEVLRPVAGVETHLVVGPAARRGIEAETGLAVAAVEALATAAYDDRDVDAAPARASFPAAGMVVAPCDTGTLAALAAARTGTLLARAGDVALREGRPLALVVTEAPWHLGDLRRMRDLARMGGVILPAMPALYPRPRTVADVVDHTVGRVLDRFGIAHGLVAEWTGTGRARGARRGPDRAR